MNDYINYKSKSNKRTKEITNMSSPKFIEDPNILDSLSKQKINSHRVMKFLNSEISYKIKDNLALDIFNNNANTLFSLLSKKNNKGAINPQKIEQNKVMETVTKEQYMNNPLHNINDGGINTNLKKIYVATRSNIDNNRRNETLFNSKNNFTSPYIGKNKEEYRKEKRVDEMIIKNEKNALSNRGELNKKYKKGNYLNKFLETSKRFNKSLKDIKNYELFDFKEENDEDYFDNKFIIYKKRNIKNNDNKSHIRINNINNNENINNINLNNEKIFYETNKDKYYLLLNNYRRRVIKQFMCLFKPYYYSFLKKHFQTFISNIKKIKNYSNISFQKRYNKRINRRNIYKFDKGIKDLKTVQINYSNNNFNNLSGRDTENSNVISSYNSKKIQSVKQFTSPYKKINHFLINNNNLNFSTKNKYEKDELYRNNLELEKKYSQILKRKERKKILTNEVIRKDQSSSKIKYENKSIDISSLNKFRKFTTNRSYERINKESLSPNTSELINSKNVITNKEISNEESIKKDKNKFIKLKIPRLQKDKDINKIKSILKKKYKDISSSPGKVRNFSGYQKKDEKKYNFKNSYIKVNKNNSRIIMVNRKDQITNINNSHYSKNIISKTIKNICTRDKKINIFIKYVFFIPQKKIQNKLKKNNKFLEITKNYSYNYIGNENENKKKIYSKKKLTSIKEEEEKSKCSISILQNPKTIDEYNSIIDYLIKKINNYKAIKMKKSFLYKIKRINLISHTKNIIKNNIFKNIKLIYIKDKRGNNSSNQKQKSKKENVFFIDGKIISNKNNMNNSNY